MAFKDTAQHAATRQAILFRLAEITPDRRELMIGGARADQIAAAVGITVQTARRTLKELQKDRRAISYSLRKNERSDGRTAASRVWFRISEEYRLRQAKIDGGT
jgi:predicted ArsR family transcriptional regulator